MSKNAWFNQTGSSTPSGQFVLLSSENPAPVDNSGGVPYFLAPQTQDTGTTDWNIIENYVGSHVGFNAPTVPPSTVTTGGSNNTQTDTTSAQEADKTKVVAQANKSVWTVVEIGVGVVLVSGILIAILKGKKKAK